jgi:hypothetical protein
LGRIPYAHGFEDAEENSHWTSLPIPIPPGPLAGSLVMLLISQGIQLYTFPTTMVFPMPVSLLTSIDAVHFGIFILILRIQDMRFLLIIGCKGMPILHG